MFNATQTSALLVDRLAEAARSPVEGALTTQLSQTFTHGSVSQSPLIFASGDTATRTENFDLTDDRSPTPRSFSSPGTFDRTFGYGLVDAAAAVAQAIDQPRFGNVTNLGEFNQSNDLIHAPEVWAQGFTGQNVVVAVVDTGVDYRHFDLNDNIWRNAGEIAGNGIDDDRNGFVDDTIGWDFSSNDNDPMDSNGHGTHVAGTIAAENNGVGITGVAYNAQIMPVRVLSSNGSGTNSTVSAGILYAANNGANVINLSLGGGYSLEIEQAIRYATQQGAIVVMAAGNASRSAPGSPAGLATEFGIAVGAVDQAGNIASFSNRAGSDLRMKYVVAPGVDIYSTYPGGRYRELDGTSMAAPHVAGVVALMLSANSTLTPDQVRQIVTDSALSARSPEPSFAADPQRNLEINVRQTPLQLNRELTGSAFENTFLNAEMTSTDTNCLVEMPVSEAVRQITTVEVSAQSDTNTWSDHYSEARWQKPFRANHLTAGFTANLKDLILPTVEVSEV